MEAEYVTAQETAKEAVQLKKFLNNLEVVPNMDKPITLYCDNSGAVANSKEPRSYKRGKHIERKYHLIREIVQRGDVTITKIASVDNCVDPFTKALQARVFEGHLESLGLRDMSHLLQGKWGKILVTCNALDHILYILLVLVQVGDCWDLWSKARSFL